MRNHRLGIVDYGRGNLMSIANAFATLTDDFELCSDPKKIGQFNRLVLPGVGSFADGMARLRETGIADALNESVLGKNVPILGICLGMQLFAKKGYEPYEAEGLGWIDGEVTKISSSDPTLKVPHIGWNDIRYDVRHPLFKRLPDAPDFYFVHSFSLACRQQDQVCATVEYGMTLTAAVHHKNILGVQFHPEKSQESGLVVLENFLKWSP